MRYKNNILRYRFPYKRLGDEQIILEPETINDEVELPLEIFESVDVNAGAKEKSVKFKESNRKRVLSPKELTKRMRRN